MGNMSETEYRQYVQLIVGMATDVLLWRGVDRATFVANLRMIANAIDGREIRLLNKENGNG